MQSGRFRDPRTGLSIDPQTLLIQKVLQKPVQDDFKEFGGISAEHIPELFTSEIVKQHQADSQIHSAYRASALT
jgi:hypothetical protein